MLTIKNHEEDEICVMRREDNKIRIPRGRRDGGGGDCGIEGIGKGTIDMS
jgi:hypothetical protein